MDGWQADGRTHAFARGMHYAFPAPSTKCRFGGVETFRALHLRRCPRELRRRARTRQTACEVHLATAHSEDWRPPRRRLAPRLFAVETLRRRSPISLGVAAARRRRRIYRA